MEAYYLTFHFHDLGSPNMLPPMTNYLNCNIHLDQLFRFTIHFQIIRYLLHKVIFWVLWDSQELNE